jgi:putative peptidoglycan lipid II flippase
VATAALPVVARHAAAGAIDDLRRTVSSSLRMMLMLSVPATVGLMVLAGPIVELIFERGEFTSDSTRLTALALIFYAPGLVGYSAVKIVSPTFYALKDSRTPVMVSVGSMVLNLVLNLTLVRVLSFQGLALGTAIAALFNSGLLVYLLSRRIHGVEGRRIAVASAKILAASLAMGAMAVATERALDASLPDMGAWVGWLGDLAPAAAQTLRAGIRVSGAIGVGVLTLGLAASALRLHEFTTVRDRLLERLRRG